MSQMTICNPAGNYSVQGRWPQKWPTGKIASFVISRHSPVDQTAKEGLPWEMPRQPLKRFIRTQTHLICVTLFALMRIHSVILFWVTYLTKTNFQNIY